MKLWIKLSLILIVFVNIIIQLIVLISIPSIEEKNNELLGEKLKSIAAAIASTVDGDKFKELNFFDENIEHDSFYVETRNFFRRVKNNLKLEEDIYTLSLLNENSAIFGIMTNRVSPTGDTLHLVSEDARNAVLSVYDKDICVYTKLYFDQYGQWLSGLSQIYDSKNDKGKGLNSAYIFETMSDVTPEDAVISVDVGNNAYSFGRYFECKKQSIIMSGYLGSIGFGYPAAMGAYAASPDRKIVAVTGDGGYAQYMAELTTAVKYNMNITHILLNNNQLGKITKEQKADEFPVWETDLVNPNFSEYAINCGALSIRVSERDELEKALKTAMAHIGPSMVEIVSDSDLI